MSMIPVHHLRALLLGVWLAMSCLVVSPVAAQPAGDVEREGESGLELPAGLEIRWQGTLLQTEDGGAAFTGPVTIVWRETRIQADSLKLRERRHIEAEGNVLLVWGQNRIYGERLTYDLETERGTIEQAIGYALDEYLIVAESIEKIGHKKLRLKRATITTCNQPLPYWSFAISSATVTLEKYARMWNVRLRGGRAPLVYLPYLIWPVKEDRAAGFLMPEFSSTQNRGDAISLPFFLPIGRSVDLTLVGRYYTEAGFMGGSELRFIPNLKGSGSVGGFFIDDEVEGDKRYRFDYKQTQEFRNGFRMVADVGLVSDPRYYSDFERDLNLASAPQSLARLEFSRNGKWSSLNVRQLRREQLSSGLVQSTYPEIEWRGRSVKLGRTPFYLAFESSAASIQQSSSTLAADYLRGDVMPEISLPWSLTWLDITPRVAYRWTHWTQHQTDAGLFQDSGLTRALWSYGVNLVGPKVFRIFGAMKEEGSKYKHTIEPQISYGFDEEFDRFDEVLDFDEIDQVRGAGTRATYAIVQRLFAKRPQQAPEPPPVASAGIVLPDGTTHQEEKAEQPAEIEDAPAVPVEIASFEVRQIRSFDGDLSTADLDGDGIREESSPWSDLSFVGRFNPSDAVSLDLRSSYDILFDAVQDVSLSGSVSSRRSSVKFSLVHRNGLGVNANTLVKNPDSTQVQLTSGLGLIRDRLKLKLKASYIADPEPGEGHFPEQHWQALYSTQCCTFLVERLTRDFGTFNSRREVFFRVDLRGVGKLLEKTF
jgi:hypothetical protein